MADRVISGGSGVLPVVIVPTGGVGRVFGKNQSYVVVAQTATGTLSYCQPIPMTQDDYDWATA